MHCDRLSHPPNPPIDLPSRPANVSTIPDYTVDRPYEPSPPPPTATNHCEYHWTKSIPIIGRSNFEISHAHDRLAIVRQRDYRH